MPVAPNAVNVSLADHLIELAPQPGVVEHLDMGREDRGRILAELLGNPVAVALHFRGGSGNRLVEPMKLVLHRVAR